MCQPTLLTQLLHNKLRIPSSLSLAHFPNLAKEDILQVIKFCNRATCPLHTRIISQGRPPSSVLSSMAPQHLVMYQLCSREQSLFPSQRNPLWISQTTATTDQYHFSVFFVNSFVYSQLSLYLTEQLPGS